MNERKALTKGDLNALRLIVGEERFRTGEDILSDYARDEMPEYGKFFPEALLFPLCGREVAEILKYCAERGIPVTTRGAGTGLCGGCVPDRGGVLLSTERMNRVLEIDEGNMTATVEPGLLLMDFTKRLEGTGLFYPPDPGEKSASLGGNAMTNAGGMRAVRYGVTRDYVLGMKLAIASGEILTLGGKTVKTSSGYNLLQLVLGSEGTLGVATELTLKLIAEPKASLSILAPFSSLEACVNAVPRVLRLGIEPTAVEFMEREIVDASETYLGRPFPEPRGAAYLLIRLDGISLTLLEPGVDALTNLLAEAGALDVLMADTDERKASIWDARGAFLEAIKSSTPELDECDVVVPRDKIAEFALFAARVGEREGVRVRSFGHAGDGNLHIYACRDGIADTDWPGKRRAVMDALYFRANEMGGRISGEHGVGRAKREYLRESVGETQIAIMRAIKAAFDPNGILNPGKVI